MQVFEWLLYGFSQKAICLRRDYENGTKENMSLLERHGIVVHGSPVIMPGLWLLVFLLSSFRRKEKGVKSFIF